MPSRVREVRTHFESFYDIFVRACARIPIHSVLELAGERQLKAREKTVTGLSSLLAKDRTQGPCPPALSETCRSAQQSSMIAELRLCACSGTVG